LVVLVFGLSQIPNALLLRRNRGNAQ
jgi:hypothetical protein